MRDTSVSFSFVENLFVQHMVTIALLVVWLLKLTFQLLMIQHIVSACYLRNVFCFKIQCLKIQYKSPQAEECLFHYSYYTEKNKTD